MLSTEKIIEIANQYGTPIYILDKEHLGKRIHDIQTILGNDITLCYAMKANPFLVDAFKSLNTKYEVCSPGEFAICEREKVNMQDVVLSGVNKEEKDICHVMDDCGGVGVYTVESVEQYRLLSDCAATRELKINVLLRVTSGNQFGLDESDIEMIIKNRESHPYINILGLQCYTGTQKKKFDIIKNEIENYDWDNEAKETGEVIWVGDGIATVYGIDHAMYGEIVVFDGGVKGMVQNIRRNEIGCILFGHAESIREGCKVIRTGKRAGIPVGDAFKGRVVNALGEAIDGKGEIKSDDYRPIENEAPGIVDRKSVSVPLETGILSIDAMFPIGRGQRELIIGDRQTGKTTIATDTILNQKGKDVICIYVAIGQKRSTVASLVENLEKNGAMAYTIVVAATASEASPLQYIVPYSGCAMGEYFMYQGKDVLIIYDDLSKHAVAYRALSLLIRRPPGREAYPGDVFYLHSRLLERAAKLDDEHGGGSMTALPIIETQAGDISAYIPTNVISITDGQIFLETELFHSGVMPAVNPGVSVSRVGGNAQIKAMKKVAGTLKLIYSQYRELASFAQFGSDLDADTKARLEQGVRIVEVLKQNQNAPVSVEKQVAILYAVTKGILSKVAAEDVRAYEDGLYTWLDTDAEGAAVMQEISATGKLEADTEEKLKSTLESYTENFINTRPAK